MTEPADHATPIPPWQLSVSAHSAAEPPRARTRIASDDDEQVRLLIVDRDVGAAIATVLARRWELLPTVASTGRDALALIRVNTFDLSLIEYRMPDMRGDAFLTEAASLQPHLREHTLFMTGDYSEAAHDAMTSTGCPYLLKPFEMGILEHELRELLD